MELTSWQALGALVFGAVLVFLVVFKPDREMDGVRLVYGIVGILGLLLLLAPYL